MQIEIEGQKYDYQQYKDALYKERMVLRIQNNKSYLKVFKKDLTKKFTSIIKNTVNPKYQFTQNILLSISGSTGSSKSSSIISLGEQYFPHFSVKNIFYYDQSILDNIHKFKPNTLLIRDENTAKGEYGLGSNRSIAQLSRLYETSRKAGLNIALIEPEFAPNPIIKYFLSTVDMDLNNRITRLALIESESYKCLGAIFVKILPDSHPLMVEYEKNKDEFIEQMRTGKTKGKISYKDLAKDCLDDLEFDKYKNKTERKAYLLNKFPNYTTGEIETILAMVNVIKREGDDEDAPKETQESKPKEVKENQYQDEIDVVDQEYQEQMDELIKKTRKNESQ